MWLLKMENITQVTVNNSYYDTLVYLMCLYVPYPCYNSTYIIYRLWHGILYY